MSASYIVMATEDGELVTCEAYAGFQGADQRARAITRLLIGNNVKINPKQEDRYNNEITWTYANGYHPSSVNGEHLFVGVVFTRIKTNEPIKKIVPPVATGFIKYGLPMSDGYQIPAKQPTIVSHPKWDNFKMPVGFDLNNKPIVAEDLIKAPFNVKYSDDLTENQRFGLTIARIRRMPQYTICVPETGGTLVQADVLIELQKKSTIGYQIMEQECNYINAIKDAAIQGKQTGFRFMFDPNQNW